MSQTFKQSEFIKSVYSLKELNLAPLPEIVLAGRSNAGKSTLINALTGRRALAKVSQKPGKTQAVNYFLIKDTDKASSKKLEFYLTDLPGYGYSVAGQNKQAEFSELTDNYLESGRSFALIILLLDIRHTPQASDLAMIEWLNYKNLPYIVVLNKADKLSKIQQKQALLNCQKLIQAPCFAISASKSSGLEDLLAYIRAMF